MLAPHDPMFKYADMDFYWQKKKMLMQNDPLNKAETARSNGATSRKYKQALPPISTSAAADRANGAVSKLELEEKTQEVLAKDEEIQTLKAKLKRLEHLITLKDTRIDDLQSQVEKLRPLKRMLKQKK